MAAIIFKLKDNKYNIIDPYYGGIWEFEEKELEIYLELLKLLEEKNVNEILKEINSDKLKEVINFIIKESIPVDTTFFPELILKKLHKYNIGIIVPPEIILEVSRMCNYNCPWCYIPSMKQEEKLLDVSEISKKIIEPFVLQGARCWTITGGEPSLTIDRTISIITKIKETTKDLLNRKPKISLLTNGFKFSEYANDYYNAGVNTVQIQLSSPKEKQELQLRNPNNKINSYKYAIDGIRSAKKLGMYTAINMVIEPKENINSICEMIELADKLDVDLLRITPVVTSGKAKQNSIDLNIKNYKKIKDMVDDGKKRLKKDSRVKLYLPDYDLENGRPMRCGLGFVDFYIDYSGKVYPCNNLIDESLVCSDGKNSDYVDIWYNSSCFKMFRNYNETNIGEECGKCEYRGMCVGNCIARCWQRYGKFDLLKKPYKCFKD
ncbi:MULTISPECIES: radical SAM/SPASM domain-containing protein [Clostridium]|uniref:radical SAM/SPASM domain-containing protein n=1 Tax=Clostridium TaxID=1485 RepID=UPI00069D360F|nr:MULTISPECIES: radical SAM protein [Clostridium]KOF57548.1 hypothetical protein AGR56_14455 [Clostridium sp. DMHC 10]MCD2348338.1 radical SAM protein [Clostridium guangxiense]